MDAALCGPICFEAFKAIDDEHNFPWDFPSAEAATGLLTMMLSNPGFYSLVAEKEGNVIGSNFLDERGPIAGVGPITVHPALQNQMIGRRLMGAVLDRASDMPPGSGCCNPPFTIVPCASTQSSASRPARRYPKSTGPHCT